MKLDYFLYSCFEYEQLCKANPNKAMAPQRWPAMLAFLDGQGKDLREIGTLQDQLQTSAAWYLEQFPALTHDRKLEMENISGIAAATVFFCLDLKLLATQDGSQTLEALCTSDQGPVWNQVDRIVDTQLSNFAHYIKAYLRWVFVKKDEQVWDVGSRPPVGRYSPGAQRRLGRTGSDSRSGPSSGGPQRRPSNGPGGGGQRSGNSGPRRNDRDRGNERDRSSEHRPGGAISERDRAPKKVLTAGSKGNHVEQERLALDAVDSAIDRLKGELSLSEIRLDPSNSFFRRLQHKKAVAEGYYSYSTGEGSERAVVVTREKPENEENS